MNNLEKFKSLNESEVLLELKKISTHFNCFSFEKNIQQSNYIDLFKKFSSAESITFFGGTFNPIHLGHLECIKLCPEENILMILDRNPQKELRSINYREEINYILDQVGDLQVSIYPGFWTQESSNPTSSWIKLVNVKEKNLLMGDDSFLKFFSWIKPEEILQEISKFYVVPRIHKQEDLVVIQNKCEQINPKIKIIYLANHEFQSLSSTAIRNQK